MVILQPSRDVEQSKSFRRQTSRRLDAWDKAWFNTLVLEAARSMESFLLAE
jgi:hypothetical protein